MAPPGPDRPPGARADAGYKRERRGANRLASALFAAAGLAAGAALVGALVGGAPPVEAPAAARVPIGGPFALVDGDGRTRTRDEFLGAPLLIAFGYTHCPDVCPTMLQTMTEALDALGPEGAAIQPVFVTVDPERDTPAVMRAHVGHFHERLVGLTGGAEQAAAAARAWRVTARKTPPDEEGNYLVDHTALTYLMDADGAYVAHFGHDADWRTMAERLRRHLETGA